MNFATFQNTRENKLHPKINLQFGKIRFGKIQLNTEMQFGPRDRFVKKCLLHIDITFNDLEPT